MSSSEIFPNAAVAINLKAPGDNLVLIDFTQVSSEICLSCNRKTPNRSLVLRFRSQKILESPTEVWRFLICAFRLNLSSTVSCIDERAWASVKFEQFPLFYPCGWAAPLRGIAPMIAAVALVRFVLIISGRAPGRGPEAREIAPAVTHKIFKFYSREVSMVVPAYSSYHNLQTWSCNFEMLDSGSGGVSYHLRGRCTGGGPQHTGNHWSRLGKARKVDLMLNSPSSSE